MPAPSYTGAWPVLITPYDAAGRIDRTAYRDLLEWYIAKGAGGLYAVCLSSEMYLLDDDERLQLITDAIDGARGRVPVAATGNLAPRGKAANLPDHIAFCRRVADAGADVVMLVVPEFIDNDADMERYFLAVAESVDAQLGLYECPYPRPYHLGVDLVATLARTGRFHAFKETSCELPKIEALACAVEDTPLSLLQANTPYLLAAMRAGTPGTMSIATNYVPELVAAVVRQARAGDPEAERLHRLLCSIEISMRAVHPLGVKYLLAKRGLPIAATSRAAIPPLSAEVCAGLDYCAAQWFDEQGELRQAGSW
jgi:4-hydroxy-tetrahydrodipicolinate synthase